jgi:hypothetical protein
MNGRTISNPNSSVVVKVLCVKRIWTAIGINEIEKNRIPKAQHGQIENVAGSLL